MSRATIRSVCPHRFLMVKGMNRTRSVEISRCYECGTSLVRPLIMTPTEWFPFPRKKLYLISTGTQAMRRTQLTEEGLMGTITKVVGVVSCGVLLCLGLSTVASSAERFNTGQSAGKIFIVDDKDRFVPGKEVKGEIVKIDGENYVVRQASGAEVRMHVDSNTEKLKSSLMPKVGEHVLAKVDASGHAVSFFTDAPVSH
jgi:hypothetical protein